METKKISVVAIAAEFPSLKVGMKEHTTEYIRHDNIGLRIFSFKFKFAVTFASHAKFVHHLDLKD